MKNLTIIPARGGSKRIARKNIKNFLGKPIIAYSIETALDSGLFDEIMVSTEDPEIADIAKRYGAKVPFYRSKENASDHATTVDVLLEVIEQYGQQGMFFENICCLYPTAPFVTPDDLKAGLEMLKDANSSLPVVKFGFPIMRALKKDKNGLIHLAWPEHETTRSQDVETYYHDAGQWYWINSESLKGSRSLITTHTKAIEKSQLLVQDIDTEEDWKLAEVKYKYINE